MKLFKHLFSGLLILLAVSSVSGCSLFGGEEDNIEVSPSPQVENQFQMPQVWTNSTSGNTKIYSLLGPAHYEDTIYVAGRSGQIKAIDANNGTTKWSTDVSKSSFFRSQSALLSGGVSVDNQHVYIGSERASVFALDRATGEVVWQQSVAGEVLAKPVSSDGYVLIHTSNGYLQALKADTGESVWKINLDVPPLSLRGQSTPVVSYGAVIVGDDNGRVNAMFLQDGLLIWQQRISQPSGSTEIARLNDVDTSPVVVDGIVYSLGYNGNMVGLDLRSGQPLWRRNVGSTHSFIIESNRIYLVDQNDNVQALMADGGSVVWKQGELMNRRLTDPVLYQGNVVVGDSEGYIYLLDPQTGEFVYKTQVNSSGLLSAPIVVGNKLVVQTRNGNIYAFER